jgi:diamine N-acetyltransferase
MIRGDRVCLRSISAADHARLAELKQDLDVELLGGGAPPAPRSVEQLVAELAARAADPDQFSFGIEVDGRLIGDCGLFAINRVDGTARLGIGIGDPACWGQGLGRDATNTLVRYAFTIQNVRKVWLDVLATNERAIRTYLSVGFSQEGVQVEQVWNAGRYVDLVLMGLRREDWLARTTPRRGPRHLNVTDDTD